MSDGLRSSSKRKHLCSCSSYASHSSLNEVMEQAEEMFDDNFAVAKKQFRGDKQDSLDATLEKIKDSTPGCDVIAVHFELRSKSRQIEIDGLDKAKAILKGAAFDEDARVTAWDLLPKENIFAVPTT